MLEVTHDSSFIASCLAAFEVAREEDDYERA
jgi:hypothetical protein